MGVTSAKDQKQTLSLVSSKENPTTTTCLLSISSFFFHISSPTLVRDYIGSQRLERRRRDQVQDN
jgi:hypothetical protein